MRKTDDQLRLAGTLTKSQNPERFPKPAHADRPFFLSQRKLIIELCDPRGRFSPTDATMLWTQHGARAVKRFADAHPGRRPYMWWRADSPNEPRRMVGGSGEALPICANPRIYCECGTAREWIHIDLTDPPKFEVQAIYLARHGLLLDGEVERLTLADQEPEELPTEFWPRHETTCASQLQEILVRNANHSIGAAPRKTGLQP